MAHISLDHYLRNMPLAIQVLLLATIAAVVFAVLYFGVPALGTFPRATATLLVAQATETLPPTWTPAPFATDTPMPTSTPPPTPALAPPEGGMVYALKPYPHRVGWVASGEEGNHLGESHIYAGTLDGEGYHGVFQFDLSSLTPGSSIYYATVELTGLDDQKLARAGAWALQMLAVEADLAWSVHTFDSIHQAPVFDTLSPVLSGSDLIAGKTQVFVLNASQRSELEKRISRGVVSFRIDGPSTSGQNLFGWDSGYGPETKGKGPILRLAAALPATAVDEVPEPETPAPTYVVITPAPTPANVLTAAARALTATALADANGTPTPLPPNWVTPIIVTATPTPENEATATVRAAMATAVVVMTGTPTPTPGNVWTATPTATYVIITPTPTVENTLTAMADALTATAWATTTGTPTSLPPNWVTPIIVTATPTPENEATATAYSAAATAIAVLTGTPTPTPENVWTATPTATPEATSTPTQAPPTPTPTPLPPTPTPVLPPPRPPTPTAKPTPPV
jgi:hypothetical protein